MIALYMHVFKYIVLTIVLPLPSSFFLLPLCSLIFTYIGCKLCFRRGLGLELLTWRQNTIRLEFTKISRVLLRGLLQFMSCTCIIEYICFQRCHIHGLKSPKKEITMKVYLLFIHLYKYNYKIVLRKLLKPWTS